ncbi:SEFIR domain protein [Candidatus Vecturithrix granuli]|uniref:SEFIR domain protein n=1 Tax=Vecturithrix granuli TaxID=1499967 RepID=A0A081C955_VECG1|nr:SEFIR domain protein [Candidatus Vecturithrix granuli]
MPKVFISYSHDSSEHAARVLALADRLIQDGLDCILDQYEGDPSEGWPLWMDRQIEQADYVLMIYTETYHNRVMGKEQAGIGRGVKWESVLTYNHIYTNDSLNTKFIPVLFAPGDFCHIPRPLQGSTYYCLNSEEGYDQLYWRLTDQHKTTKPIAGQLRKRSQTARNVVLSPEKIFLAKLPTTGSELFGREEELELLDNAWTDPHTHIVSIVAWGGVGKTALVNEWLNRMGRDNYRGAERVYGWSFYSQGTREDRQISADEFIFHALSWFGDSDPTQGSSWDRGVRLAGLIRQHRTLLILDGVEPLQYPPGEMQGRLRDQGLQALLKELARFQSGLCILTTRLAVKDLEHATKSSVKRVFLEHLSSEAGAKLLETLGVKGATAELHQTANEFKGHALALNLLGRYLAVAHDGDIRKRDLIPNLTEEEEQGGHARRVMESYECWLSGTSELNILYMMGLFDRPATNGAIEALKIEPPIKGLTSELHQLIPAKWLYAVKHLRDLRLLSEKNENSPDTLDCHPLIREHFSEKLRNSNPDAWKEAHSRLYEYYKNLPEKRFPDTLEEMEPLFTAVTHGCQAGRYQETFDTVYWQRILREGEGKGHYSTKKLGAFGIDLQALSNFFENSILRWSYPISDLKEKDKGKILGLAGFRLRALGRLREARQAMELAIDVRIKQENWKGAAVTTGNLSELCLTMGNVNIALKYAQQSVNFADLSGDGFERDSKRTVLANILHNAGKYKEAENLFIEAESMQKERLPGYPYLYSVQGFRFCDLLLSLGRYQEVQNRAFQSLNKKSEPDGRLLDIALDKLSLGKSSMLQLQEEESDNFFQVEEYLKQAVEDFRNAGTQHHLPQGLLARATLHRLQHKFVKAREDLEEVQEIAERGSMRLYIADYHLEACRLCLAERKLDDAQQHLSTAKTMIDEMGYHRRDKEVEELTEALKNKEADSI